MAGSRLVPPALAAVAAIAIAGCGGEGDSGAELAGFAPPGSLVFVEAEARPTGMGFLDDFVVARIERSVDGPLDYAKEVEPWLGERASISFGALEDGEPRETTIAVETTDAGATQELIDGQAGRSASYRGIDFKVGGDRGIGVIGDSLVIAEGEAGFRAAVDAARGKSLADEARFGDAIAAASEGSFADVYMDVDGLFDASRDEIDPRAREALEGAGVATDRATAVASVFPGRGQVKIDLSGDLGGDEAPGGDASELIGSLPADSVAAAGTSGFGDRLERAIGDLDASGLPGDLPPKQLKSALRAAGIEKGEISESFEDAAAFVRGRSEATPRGALVLTGDSGEAAQTVADLGAFLRSTGTPGVTAVGSGGASGFSVRSPDLGQKPVFVVAKGRRVAIGYELSLALQGLRDDGGETLSGASAYRAAVSSLGDIPITAYAHGPEALPLAESLISPSRAEDLREAGPLLKRIEYVAMGDTGTEGGLATAELIVGLER